MKLKAAEIQEFLFYGATVRLARNSENIRGLFTVPLCMELLDVTSDFDGARLPVQHWQKHRYTISQTPGFKNNILLDIRAISKWRSSLLMRSHYAKYRNKIKLLAELPKAIENFDAGLGDWPFVAVEEPEPVLEAPPPVAAVASAVPSDETISATLDLVVAPTTQLPFHGTNLIVAETNGGIWVSTRRICETIGLDPEVARQFLSRQSWSCTSILLVQLPGDSQSRDHHFIHRSKLPMWLGTLNQSAVSEEARPFLEALQNDVCDVLDAHYNKPATKPVAGFDMQQVATLISNVVTPLLAPVMAACTALVTRVSQLESLSRPALPGNTVVFPRTPTPVNGEHTAESICGDNGGGHPGHVTKIALKLRLIGDPRYGFGVGVGETLHERYWQNWRYNNEGERIVAPLYRAFRDEAAFRKKKKVRSPVESALKDCLAKLQPIGNGTWNAAQKYCSSNVIPIRATGAP